MSNKTRKFGSDKLFIKQIGYVPVMSLKTRYLILNIITAILLRIVCTNEIPPYIEAMRDEMSPTLYMSFGEKSKEYIPNELNNILNDTRKLFEDIGYIFVDFKNSWFGLTHYGGEVQRAKVCVFIQVSYKNAIKQIKHYYDLRALYTETKEYEVGYLTHEIIFRYQIMLELYQMIETRHNINPKSNVAPTSLLLYFYSNILEESQAIIHLCNMLHEIDGKYKYNSGIKKKHDSVFKDNYGPNDIQNRTLGKDEQYERYMKMKKREAQRKERERKKQRKLYKKFGITTMKVEIYQTKKSRFPLHYGWSLEDWPPKQKGEKAN